MCVGWVGGWMGGGWGWGWMLQWRLSLRLTYHPSLCRRSVPTSPGSTPLPVSHLVTAEILETFLFRLISPQVSFTTQLQSGSFLVGTTSTVSSPSQDFMAPSRLHTLVHSHRVVSTGVRNEFKWQIDWCQSLADPWGPVGTAGP